jgi:hypothetical protein
MFNFLPLVGSHQMRMEMMTFFFHARASALAWLVFKYAFLLHSSEENDDMSVHVDVIHFRVGLTYFESIPFPKKWLWIKAVFGDFVWLN